jgi:DNA-binding CsgD family transcriptional regulator
VRALYGAGKRPSEIAELLDISRARVYQLLRRDR